MNFIVAFLKLRRAWFWFAALLGLSVALAFVPLFNLLSYEFCLALSVAATSAAIHLGSAQVSLWRAHHSTLVPDGSPAMVLTRLLLRGVSANLLLLALPLLVICLNALRVKNCDLLEGLAFFAMMPLLSTALASCVGMVWGLAFTRPALATAAGWLTVLLCWIWGLWRFYSAPPVFAYDPFIGYFAGSLYDENVAIRPAFMIYRVHNLLWLAGMVLAAAHFFKPASLRLRPRRPSPRPLLTPAALLLLAAGAVLFSLRGPLGFAVDAEHIQQSLGGERRTDHFSIYYPEEMEPEEVDLLAQDHEFRYFQLQRLLGAAPRLIRSYIFRSAQEKQHLMGAGSTYIAKPWRREIYMQEERFPYARLKHELAHVFAGQWGDRLFGVSVRWRWSPLPFPSFNVGLIEGLAVAADWRADGELTGHQRAAALRRIGLAPPAGDLFSAKFLTLASSRGYTMAGSFCRYLLEQRGPAKLTRVYHSGGDFEAAYGEPLPALLARWSDFLSRVEVPARALQLARERFRRPSILRRVCGHEVANLLDEASRLSGQRQFRQAAQVLQRVCRFDPDDPLHGLRLARTLAAAGQYDQALSRAEELLKHPALSKPLQRQALELAGDLSWWEGDLATAGRWYGRALQVASGPYGRRVLFLKRWGLSRRAETADLVQRYIAPRSDIRNDGALAVHLAHRLQDDAPDSGLGLYLAGMQLAGRGHCRQGAAALSRALKMGLPNTDFEVECQRSLALCQYRLGHYGAASKALMTLRSIKDLPAGTGLAVADLQSRLRWQSARGARSIQPVNTTGTMKDN